MAPRGLADAALDLARAATEGVQIVPSLLEMLDHHVGGDALSSSRITFVSDTRAEAEVTVRGADALRPEEDRRWQQLMHRHPLLPHLGRPGTVRLTDAVDLQVFERTRLFRELLLPRDSRYQAAVVLDRPLDGLSVLSLWRATRDFTDLEMTRLESVRQLVASAAAFHRASEAVRAWGPDQPTLSRRQRQVAALIETGLTNLQIAHRLGITERTVRKHVEALFERTGARSRAEVAARRRGPAAGPAAG